MRTLKRSAGLFLQNFGVLPLVSKLRGNTVTILMYHKVIRNNFEAHIKHLSENYKVISLDNAVERLKKRKLDSTYIAITFDDGYKNFKEEAYPVLKKYNVPATVFLTNDFIDNKTMAWWDIVRENVAENEYESTVDKLKTVSNKERIKAIKSMKKPEQVAAYQFLTQKDLKTMKYLVSYGSHTLTHPILTVMQLDEAKKEIKDSKRKLERLLGHEIKHFCYPNGSFNERIKSAVQDAGYESACAVTRGHNKPGADLFALKRIGINEIDDMEILKVKLAL